MNKSNRFGNHRVSTVLVALVMLTMLMSVLKPTSSLAADVPASFTLDGQLFADTASTTPLLDANVTVKIQILDDDRVCVLYEEAQTVNTVFSKGYFSIQIGSAVADVKRTSGDSANAMPAVFQNLNNVSGKKLSDSTLCTVTAAGGKRRYVRVTITPPTLAGGPRVLSPDLTIDSVPNSIVSERAESLQGLRASEFLKVNTASGSALTQANLDSLFTSTTRFNALTSVVDGTSTNYMRTTAAGAQLPVFTGAPTSPTQGSIWFDTSDQKLKYRTGSGTTEIVGTGAGGSGTVTSVSAAATSGNPITIGGTSTVAPTIDLPSATASANGYLKSSDWTIFNNKQTSSLADGSIWIGSGAPSVATARAVSGDVALSNTGVTAVNKIKGVALSATAPTDGQVLKYVDGTTSWTPSSFSIGDLKTAAGAQQFAGSTACTAAQTLTWSSLTDTFTCTNIAGLAGSVITSGTVDAARLPASAGAWTVTGGDISRDSGKITTNQTTTSATNAYHFQENLLVKPSADASAATYTGVEGNSATDPTSTEPIGKLIGVTGTATASAGAVTEARGGYFSAVNMSTSSATNSNYGVYGESGFGRTGGTILNSYGVYGISSAIFGNITNSYGGSFVANQITIPGASTVANSYGVYAETKSASSRTVTNGYGVYAKITPNAGTITNRYGLYIADVTSGATFYNLYSDGNGKNYFGGSVGIGTSTPATKLDVNGTASVSASIESAAAYVNSSTAYAIADASLNIRRIDVNANTTITLPAFTAPALKMYSITIFLRQDATGSRTVAFAGNGSDTIKWDSGVTTPAISTTAGKITIVQLTKASDESVWYGSVVWKEN